VVALIVAANVTFGALGKIEAGLADLDAFIQIEQGLAETLTCLPAAAQQIKRQPLGRARPDTWQLTELLDYFLN
jgi:hypothetical protein